MQGCGGRIHATKRGGGAVPHPFPLLSPRVGRNGRVVETMTDLVLMAVAILELAASTVQLVAVILERLPIRKDGEPPK